MEVQSLEEQRKGKHQDITLVVKQVVENILCEKGKYNGIFFDC
jgi:hypothetical protein